MVGAVFGVIIALALSIAAGIFMFKTVGKVKQIQSTKYDRSELKTIKNTQDILPFKDIRENRIFLGNHKYVAYLKVEPYNYVIQSEEGKDSFAIRLRRAFNSFNFPFRIFTHTRKMTTERMLKNLENNIQKITAENPEQREYASQYFDMMSVINVRNADTGALRLVKDYYFVISWEPDSDTIATSKAELDYQAREGLLARMRIVHEQLAQAGIKSHFLTTEEIIHLLTDIYHRDENNRADLVYQREYTSEMVAGDQDTLLLPNSTQLKTIVDGAISNLNITILDNPSMDNSTKDNGIKVYNVLEQLRDKLVKIEG